MTFLVIGSRRLASARFLHLDTVHLLGPGRATVVRDVVRHPGGVGILVVDGPELLFVRQYRVAAGGDLLEIPAGKLDRGENPSDTARRELEEELGVAASWIEPLGRLLPSPGYTDETIHLFVAGGIVPTQRRPDGAEEQQAAVVRMPATEAYRMLDAGEIVDAKTQIALMAWARKEQR